MASKKKTSPKKAPEQTTYYYLVLDESGSMNGLTTKVRELYRQKVNDLFNAAEANNQKVRGSFIKFDDRIQTMVLRSDREGMLDNTIVNGYQPHGWTKLFDAVMQAIKHSKEVALGSNDSVLIEVITDGQENQSLTSYATLFNEMRNCSNSGQYTFVFQLPVGQKSSFLQKFQVFSDNVREWETNEQGWTETVAATSQAYSGYMGNRSKGLLQTTSFYADIDVSDVGKTDLKNLDNVTNRFKTFEVNKEAPIKDFVEEKTKKAFVLGSAAYQLSKPEMVRPNREILISEKGKKTIYGGPKVRKLLGLPDTGNVKVNPHNLGAYNIYVQSASVNRKLVRGTTLLVDLTKNTNLAPTWGTIP